MRTRSLLQPRVGAVLALEDPAISGHVESIHDFRVATRSLRAALRTLTRRPENAFVRETRRALQAATRALADARDRDVGHALLARMPATTVEDAALRRRILGLSDSDRRVALTSCLAQWPRHLDRLLIRLLDRAEPSVETVIRRTRAEAWKQRRRALLVLRAIGRRYDPVRLHELRRRVRSLRYAIEVLFEVDLSARARVIQIKPLQSALGDAQDCIVLSRWLQQQAVHFGRTDRTLSTALRERARLFRTRSMQAHEAFLALKPQRLLEGLALHIDTTVEPGQRSNDERPSRHRPQARIHSARVLRHAGLRSTPTARPARRAMNATPPSATSRPGGSRRA